MASALADPAFPTGGASQQNIGGIGNLTNVDVIYLDFTKACDKVVHGI